MAGAMGAAGGFLIVPGAILLGGYIMGGDFVWFVSRGVGVILVGCGLILVSTYIDNKYRRGYSAIKKVEI